MRIIKNINNIFKVGLFLLVTSTYSIVAQIPEYLKPGEQFEFRPLGYEKTLDKNFIQKVKSNLYVRPYDVLSYSLELDWYNILKIKEVTGDYRQFKGCNTLKIKIDSNNISALTFDAIDLIIDSVKSYESNFKLKLNQTSKSFEVDLPSMKFSGDTISLKIYYTYIGKQDGGFYLYEQGRFLGIGPPPKRDSIFTLERLAYTMSEPQDARKWMPCNDTPFDKAFFDVTVKVPKGFTVVANGLLKKLGTSNDTTTFHFAPKDPLTTYLCFVAASKYKQITEYYKSKSNPLDSIPLDYYVWEQDWKNDTINGTAYNAQYSFRNTLKMMDCFTSVFGDYPYEKYGMVAVIPFNSGGMEHQTLTMVHRSWLRGYSESGIAHELAHQWLGDLITCATWYDLWINEGGGTWGEALWEEYLNGHDAYYDYMNKIAQVYFNEDAIFNVPIYALPINSLFTSPFYLLSYHKASWVYHMLREQLGDEIFFPALRKVLDKNRFRSLETIDYMNSFKEVLPESKIDFDTFFDQWIIKAGHPILKMNTSTYDWGSGKSKVNINIMQVQEGNYVPYVFKTLIEFQFFKNSKLIESRTDLLDNKIQDFEYFLDFYPDSIAINQNKLLCQIQENLLSIKTIGVSSSINSELRPNPVISGNLTTLNLQIDKETNSRIDIYDSFGKNVQSVYNGILYPGNYEVNIPTKSLPSGVYFIQIRLEKKLNIQKLIIVE